MVVIGQKKRNQITLAMCQLRGVKERLKIKKMTDDADVCDYCLGLMQWVLDNAERPYDQEWMPRLFASWPKEDELR